MFPPWSVVRNNHQRCSESPWAARRPCVVFVMDSTAPVARRLATNFPAGCKAPHQRTQVRPKVDRNPSIGHDRDDGFDDAGY
jgi:hypothetical protein